MIKYKTFMVSFLCLLVAYGFVIKLNSSMDVEVVEKRIDKFPYRIGDYVGADIKMQNSVIKELDTDAYIFRKYFYKQNEEITLYIGYYGTKKGGRTGHNPNACYPAGGWAILKNSKSEVSSVLNNQKINFEVNSMQIKKGESNEIVFHWYQTMRKKVLVSGIDINLHRFKNLILYNRNDGAFIRVSAPITQSQIDTKSKIKHFIKMIFPLIAEHWPKESQVKI